MKLNTRPSILVFFVFLLSSCVNNLDFDDHSLNISPVYETPLISFSFAQEKFVDVINNVPIVSVSESSRIEAFDNPVVQDYLRKIELDLEIDNEINRDVTVVVDFLNANSQIVHTLLPFQVSANSLNNSFNPVINVGSTPGILQTRRIQITITISSGPLLDPNIFREFRFKSKGTYFFKI